jgi:8-oxo-dGTP pyrophosphatase MutT (NUDIX family)
MERQTLETLLWDRPHDYVYYIKDNFIYLNDFQLSVYNKPVKNKKQNGLSEEQTQTQAQAQAQSQAQSHTKTKSLKTLLKQAIKGEDLKKKYKNVYCVNCGEKGHVVKDCDGPITSFGIIAFKIVNTESEERGDKNKKLQEVIDIVMPQSEVVSATTTKQYPKIKFLMIQRKDTMGYIDFIRGKYPEDDDEKKASLLGVWLNEMTTKEKTQLLTQSFDVLWDNLWMNHESKCYKNEYHSAKRKFERLDLKTLIGNSKTYYEFQEFSFAKGRRNMKERNITCAEREFYEETGYAKSEYQFIKNYPPIQEEFTGTNGIRYRHIYYLVKMIDNVSPPVIDEDNIVQTGEVQNIGWMTYQECIALIRPYDHAKRKAIQDVYADILKMKGDYQCTDFYTFA